MNNINIDINIPEKLNDYLPELEKTHKKFINKTVCAIIKGGSVLLTEIGRKLERSGDIESKRKWLNRNLVNKRWNNKDVYKNYWTKLKNKGQIKAKTVISIDIGDIQKEYAEKMEALAEVRDGVTGKIGNGYWLVEMQAITEKGKQIPLLLDAFSQNEKGFKSQNKVLEEWLNQLFDCIGESGIAVSDRGLIWPKYVKILANRAKQFVIRLKRDTPLMFKNKKTEVSILAPTIPINYTYQINKANGSKAKIEMGFLPVKYADIEEQLYLIVVKTSWLKYPMYLLTNINPRYKGNLAKIRKIYLLRWGVEDAGRFYKQSFKLEQIRVMTLYAIRRLCLLCVFAFLILELVRQKGGVLLKNIIKSSQSLIKGIKFLYYQILRGLSTMLSDFP